MPVTGVSAGRSWPSRGDLDRLANAVQGDGPLAEHGARLDNQIVQLRALGLIGLLEAVDERAALDGGAAADRIDARMRNTHRGATSNVHARPRSRLPLTVHEKVPTVRARGLSLGAPC